MSPGRFLRLHLAAWSGLLASACGSSATTSSSTTIGDGGPRDASTALGVVDASTALGAVCAESQACSSGVCLLFRSNVQDVPGICSALCSNTAECGGAGACIPVAVLDGGACYPTCSAPAGCAGGLPCVWNPPLDAGLCQPLPTSFCSGLASLGPDAGPAAQCEKCLGVSCCAQVTACAEDVACSKLEWTCAGMAGCANALQASDNKAAQGLGSCTASSCAASCQ